MKRILFSMVFALVTTMAIAQFGTAHDFTVTDINGEEFHLYEHLDAGKVVVLDVSATWCGPCWNFHSKHLLQELHDLYGPDGTDQVRVLFYEGDPNTDDNALHGISGNTIGDWVGDATYPFVNEAGPLSLDLSIYAPQGFPTVSVIRPGDYEITHDVWQASTVTTIENAIGESIDLGNPNSINEALQTAKTIGIFPNPVSTELTIDLSETTAAIDNTMIVNTLGQVISTQVVANENMLQLNVAALPVGFYFVHFQENGQTVASKKFQKQ